MTDRERCERDEAEAAAEFPVCSVCDGRIGLTCAGHCLNCLDKPKAGEDYCPACIAKINRMDPTVFE